MATHGERQRLEEISRARNNKREKDLTDMEGEKGEQNRHNKLTWGMKALMAKGQRVIKISHAEPPN